MFFAVCFLRVFHSIQGYCCEAEQMITWKKHKNYIFFFFVFVEIHVKILGNDGKSS